MICPVYKGIVSKHGAATLYLLPRRGFRSVEGLLNSLLYAVNYDRSKKGKPLLAKDALDPAFINTVPKEHWQFADFYRYLAFDVPN